MKPVKKIKPKKTMNKNIVPKRKKDVEKEINRILVQNMSKMDLNESHIPFASRFLRSLMTEASEAPEPQAPSEEAPVADSSSSKSPEDFTPEGDKENFQKSLEPTTDPNEFETEGVPSTVTSGRTSLSQV